jgi:hypothetical protein
MLVGMRRENHEERREWRYLSSSALLSSGLLGCRQLPSKDIVCLDCLERNQDQSGSSAIPEKLPGTKLRLAKGPESRFGLATSKLRQIALRQGTTSLKTSSRHHGDIVKTQSKTYPLTK